MNSPLGQYAPVVAAVVSVGVIGAYVLALIFHSALGIEDADLTALSILAVAAFGAVIGSAVAVNGWKQPVQALHSRVDALEIGTGVQTHVDDPPVDPTSAA